MVNIGNSWDDILKDEFEKQYYKDIREFLKKEYTTKTVFPSMYDIFNALKYTPYEDVKVVILGQDPYHGIGQAHGLSFSVKKGITPPPSLKNIYKEIENDLNIEMDKTNGELTSWANQGVLMLNASLTVLKGQPNSHSKIGWEKLTDSIIEKLNYKDTPVVYLLWGRNAQMKENLITNKNHLILKCAHPSPYSANNGFFGCKHFSKTNEFLKNNGLVEINWCNM
ncbi:uracil-DNA glycosylase 2 [Peptoanaerobacter stomatis]|jgi:uracil-DNA glycosylase|uniref:Uracil-DNA glycosylase n=1 Tax=Peptoanaerobacter stomatis TaxID=796937 RepID=G9XEW5_9FIRM|nr:uracil-DNA glycosylase [Peptoanaerobacter stomatis]EHL17945.1 uracil-DNA glycosylase 2 [Peptoanaerobacter stomatis]